MPRKCSICQACGREVATATVDAIEATLEDLGVDVWDPKVYERLFYHLGEVGR